MKLRIVSPSSGALKMFPKRFNYGLEFLKKNGYDIDISKNALKNASYYSSSENDRINDIYKSIDEEVDVVIAAIGGYNSNQLLDYLDYEKIKNSKTTFMGYSDITSLLLAVHTMTGKIVYHGPTFLPELCEYPACMDYTWNYFEKAINKEKIEYKEPQYEVTEYIDWALQEKNEYKARKKEENRCPRKIFNGGNVTGRIIGGNLISILNILGSKYLPVKEFDNKILFLEDVNISIGEFDSFIKGCLLQGMFNNIKGLIFGKFVEKENNERIIEVLEKYFSKLDIPIIYNVDLGHTNPMITIPIGANVQLKADNKIVFKILDYGGEK